jgi:phosphoserine phosphatase RsbU/P
MRKLVLLAMLTLALPACAQMFNLERDRVPVTVLDGLMRFHTGDDARWSDPGFDDSAWPRISSTTDWSAQGYKNYGGFAWYRFKVTVPREHRQLGLYLPQILTSYQVFADGRLLGSFGGFPPHATVYNIHQHLVLLPPESGGQMTIAIRVWHWPQWAMFYGGGIQQAPRIGDAGELQRWMMLQNRDTFWQMTDQGCSALLCFLYGTAGFALLLMRRRELVYLWYGITGYCFGSASLLSVYAAFHDLPQFLSAATGDLLAALGFFSFVMFLWLLLGAPRTIWIWVSFTFLAFHAAMWILPISRHLSVSVGNVVFLAIDLPLFTGTLVILIQGVRRRDPDARLLLIPVALNTLANVMNDGLFVFVSAGQSWAKPIWIFWNQTFNWPFPFGLYDLSIWIILLAVMAILILRFARSRQEEEQLKSELDAAEVVQRLLIPEKAPDVKGFRIESSYKPARHVGGDFFYLRPDQDGGLLVVVGDVSGKGLRAAMTVNSVIGALRTMPALPPSRILSDLNRGLVGQMQGGFVTCCAAQIGNDGKIAYANAGHLPPYLDGVEVPVSTCFPLGIAADAQYAESNFQLHPASRLTLISDGVIEAQNAAGELFGFERTAAISRESADQIAKTAQHFGQEDDITVLTLEFAPKEDAYA